MATYESEEEYLKDKINKLVEKGVFVLPKGDKGDKPVAGVDFPIPKNGKDYTITEKDYKKIAEKVECQPKIIEKVTEIIKEIPIVTENVIEVAKYESADIVVNKINDLPIEPEYQIEISHIKDLNKRLNEIQLKPNKPFVGGGPKIIKQLLDVNAPNPSNGDTLVYDTSTQTWVAQAGGGGTEIGTPVVGGTADRILYIDASGNLAQDSSLTFDSTDKYLNSSGTHLGVAGITDWNTANPIISFNGSFDGDVIGITGDIANEHLYLNFPVTGALRIYSGGLNNGSRVAVFSNGAIDLLNPTTLFSTVKIQDTLDLNNNNITDAFVKNILPETPSSNNGTTITGQVKFNSAGDITAGILTGVGTSFTTELKPGDKLNNTTGGASGELGNQAGHFYVKSITSDTVLTLNRAGGSQVVGTLFNAKRYRALYSVANASGDFIFGITGDGVFFGGGAAFNSATTPNSFRWGGRGSFTASSNTGGITGYSWYSTGGWEPWYTDNGNPNLWVGVPAGNNGTTAGTLTIGGATSIARLGVYQYANGIVGQIIRIKATPDSDAWQIQDSAAGIYDKVDNTGKLFVRRGLASAGTFATVGGSIVDSFTDTTVGGAETDIYTHTLAASVLGTNGDKVTASYGGNFVTVGTEIVQLKVYFGGTAIWDSTGIAVTTGTSSWNVDVKIIRVSSTVVRYNVSLNTTGASGFVYSTVGELTGLTLSNTNILKITGTSSGVGSGSGDIIGKMAFVEFKPSA